ncbi:hypothetical protein CsSME_00028303 [Camellia sinensis var. sinensis]
MDELVLKRMKTPNLLPKPLIGLRKTLELNAHFFFFFFFVNLFCARHEQTNFDLISHFLPSKKFVRPCPAVLVYRTKHEPRKGTP